MKRLHRALLRALPLPLVAAFATLMFLLLLQFLIRYLPELVGRGLPTFVIVELIAYSLSYMVTLAVPMAWLIALLVAFGRLAESRAYAVVKSAGVSLPRLAWPVVVVSLALTAGMAYYNNVVLPDAMYRLAGLWRDIRLARPAFALEPGVYYTGLQGYGLRAELVPPDSSGVLLGVTVFDEGRGEGEPATLVAARARLGTDAGGTRLVLTLEDGEVHRRTPGSGQGSERYERLAFRRHRLALDLSDLGFERREDDEGLRGDRTMRTSAMLALVDSIEGVVEAQTDSLAAAFGRLGRPVVPDTAAASTAASAAASVSLPSPLSASPPVAPDAPVPAPDAPAGPAIAGPGADERAAVYDLAIRRARGLQQEAESAVRGAEWERQRADRYMVEVYKKSSIALACFVLVFVGIPLGLAVPRGGVGLVASLAVFTFLFYWVSLVQGEKLADRGLLTPEIGMWAANVILGLLGLYLTVREGRDPAYRDPIRRLAGLFQRRK